ncbi:hypothetical protein OpiT1DRAFT_02850 [Opitutaceae bacterium TAV1]|nr:hypothetical protein OpiT1DRAFT_02850 [Opitutaceae bacterium TAV1]
MTKKHDNPTPNPPARNLLARNLPAQRRLRLSLFALTLALPHLLTAALSSPPPPHSPSSSSPAPVPPARSLPPQAPFQTPSQIPSQVPPQVPPNVLFRPTFLTPDFPLSAGTAFRLRDTKSGLHYLVTSHSLLGPAGGLTEQMSPMDISRVVMALAAVSCTDPRTVLLAQPYVFLEDARPTDGRGSERDLALFALPPPVGLQPALLLDPGQTLLNDRVWLLLKYAGQQVTGMEPAVIMAVTPTEIRYLCENDKLDLSGAAGAPLLSPQGRVVGMHLGTLRSKSGRTYGYACPAGAIQQVLDPSWSPAPSPAIFAR